MEENEMIRQLMLNKLVEELKKWNSLSSSNKFHFLKFLLNEEEFESKRKQIMQLCMTRYLNLNEECEIYFMKYM
jgi:hypothetical protein